MPSNADYTREYFQIIDELDGDIESRRAAFNYMQDSTAIVHHQVVASSFVPRLFNRKTYEVMKRTAETSHRILCKVIERYRADEEYRKLFDFDERLVELILLPRDYDSVLPFARVDTFLNEDDYRIHFCEFNGDGSAGMNENREITNSIVGSDTFRTFVENHAVQGCDLFMPWVRAFMDIYGTYRFKVENPRVAICDYLENGVVDEFHIFAEKFREAGVECVVADVRELSFNVEVLTTPDGLPVNAIWRRSVTNDVLEFWDDSQDLINAVRARKVALIGAFSGHIVHDKQLFEVLFKPETQAFLTEEEIAFGLPQRRSGEHRPDPRQPRGVDHQAHRPLRCRQRVRRLRGESGGVGARHRRVRQRARRLPLHCAALHPPLQDRHAAAGPRHQRGARRRRGKRAGALQQPERSVPVQRPLPGRLQPAGAAPHDFEDQRRHDRGHYLGRLRRARWAGAVNGIR